MQRCVIAALIFQFLSHAEVVRTLLQENAPLVVPVFDLLSAQNPRLVVIAFMVAVGVVDSMVEGTCGCNCV